MIPPIDLHAGIATRGLAKGVGGPGGNPGILCCIMQSASVPKGCYGAYRKSWHFPIATWYIKHGVLL